MANARGAGKERNSLELRPSRTEVENCSPQTRSGLLSVFISKVLLKHSRAQSITSPSRLLLHYSATVIEYLR